MQSFGLQPETRASHNGKARGVEEAEAVAALGQVNDVLAMQRAYRAGIGSISIVVIGKPFSWAYIARFQASPFGDKG